MKTKDEIVLNWLPRYTGTPLESFGQYILLTNFKNYVDMFAEKFGVEIKGNDRPMQTATAHNITIINFGMGSPMAATVMDILSAIKIQEIYKFDLTSLKDISKFLGNWDDLSDKEKSELTELDKPIFGKNLSDYSKEELIKELNIKDAHCLLSLFQHQKQYHQG